MTDGPSEAEGDGGDVSGTPLTMESLADLVAIVAQREGRSPEDVIREVAIQMGVVMAQDGDDDLDEGELRKRNVYLPDGIAEEMQDEAARLRRSLSWVALRAWRIARNEIRTRAGGNVALLPPRGGNGRGR